MNAVKERRGTPTLTAQEKKELVSLERRFAQGQRESIVALQEIRERKLYRAEYKTFDAYMSGRWNRTRQWATQQIGWLRRQELLESLDSEFGKGIYQLTVAEALALAPLEPTKDSDDANLYATLYLQAVKDAQDEADSTGSKRTTEILKKAVERKTQFLQDRQRYGEDLTCDEADQLERLKDKKSYADTRSILAAAREISAKESRYSAECLEELVDKALKNHQESHDKPEQADESKDHNIYEVELYGDLADLVTAKPPFRVDGSKLKEILHLVQNCLQKGRFKDGGVRLRLVTDKDTEKPESKESK